MYSSLLLVHSSTIKTYKSEKCLDYGSVPMDSKLQVIQVNSYCCEYVLKNTLKQLFIVLRSSNGPHGSSDTRECKLSADPDPENRFRRSIKTVFSMKKNTGTP